jgi:protein-S-isoprenylcysteine O-methyltransferase Ste14
VAPTRPLFPRLGAWLFRRRTAIPVPLALALLLLPSTADFAPAFSFLAGALIVAAAEGLRLWAVRHIGVISRTRSDRLGPLVATGPFAIVRNPLYVGNIALWSGFAVSAGLPWLVPIFLGVLALEYHAIVRWEEELLTAKRGDEYRAYVARVPRWLPFARPPSANEDSIARVDRHTEIREEHVFPWRDTLFSERGTLIAIGVGYLLLWLKSSV